MGMPELLGFKQFVKMRQAMTLDTAYRIGRTEESKNYLRLRQYRAKAATVANRGINAIPQLFTAANSRLTKMEINR